MIDIQTALDEGIATLDRYGDPDTWRTAEFGGTEAFDQYMVLSLRGVEGGRSLPAVIDSAVSFGIVMERLRAKEEQL